MSSSATDRSHVARNAPAWGHRLRSLAALLSILLAAGAPPAQSRPEPLVDVKTLEPDPNRFADPRAAARDYLAAFRAGDGATMQRLVDEAPVEKLDWFSVAQQLLELHAASGTPAENSDFLAAARSLAERVGGRPQGEGLPDLVASWARFTKSDFEQEAKLRQQIGRLDAALRRDVQEAVAVAAEATAAIESLPDSCTLAMSRFQIGLVYSIAGRLDEATRSYTAAARIADRLRWHDGRAEILVQAASVARTRGDSRRALALMEAERTIRERLGHPRRLAELELAIGELHQFEGAYGKALAAYELARQQYERLQDPTGTAHAMFSLGCVHKLRLEHAEARDCFLATVETFDRLGDHVRAVRARSNAGEMVFALGQHEEGFRRLEEAAKLAVETKAQGALSEAYSNLADAHRVLGRIGQAMDLYSQSRQAALAQGQKSEAAACLGNIGWCLSELGRFAEAIDAHERCIAEMEAMGRRMNAAEGLVQLGALRLDLRDYEAAITVHERAIAHLDALGEDRVLGSACYGLGVAHSWLGQGDRAIAAFERARATYEKQGNRGEVAKALEAIGRMQAFHGQTERGLEILAAAQGRLQELGDRAGVGSALRGRALAHLKQGEQAKALELLDLAMAEYQAVGDQLRIAPVLETTARAQLELGQTPPALAAARKAIDIWSLLGRDLSDVDALAVSNRNTDASYLGLWAAHLLASSHAGTAEPALAEALWFVESGRGRLLTSGLVNRAALLRANVSPELGELESSARREFQTAQRALAALAHRAADAKDVDAARLRLDAAYRALESAVARTQREATRVAQIVAPQPVDLASLRAALRADEVVLLYLTGEDHTFVTVIGKESGRIVDLGATDPLVARAETWIELLAVSGSDEAGTAARLYDLLLRPLEGDLAGKRRLLISPEGVLTFLPFEALLRNSSDAKERVLERWETAYVPSASVLVALRAEAARAAPGRGLLALGDPVYPGEDDAVAATPIALRDAELRGLGRLRRLRGSGDEVRAIGALFPEARRTILLRAEATVGRLEAALAAAPERLAAVHFACHGHVDLDRPRLTGLVLAGGEMLTLDHLYGAKVPADLAVLSACETAKGRFYRGEGVVGLVRGFIFAGCPRVVVSDWRVDDEGTRALMAELYRQLLVERLAPAAALRAAKRKQIGAGQAHPYHWAAFVAWGLPD